MSSDNGGRKGKGSKNVTLAVLICILIVLIIIVVKLIFSPEEKIEVLSPVTQPAKEVTENNEEIIENSEESSTEEEVLPLNDESFSSYTSESSESLEIIPSISEESSLEEYLMDDDYVSFDSLEDRVDEEIGNNEDVLSEEQFDAGDTVLEDTAEVIEEPVEIIDVPAEVIEEPVEVIEEPVEIIEEPVEIIEEPVEIVEEPVEIVEEPVEIVEEPVEIVEEPAEEIDEPVEVIDEPAEEIELIPVDEEFDEVIPEIVSVQIEVAEEEIENAEAYFSGEEVVEIEHLQSEESYLIPTEEINDDSVFVEEPLPEEIPDESNEEGDVVIESTSSYEEITEGEENEVIFSEESIIEEDDSEEVEYPSSISLETVNIIKNADVENLGDSLVLHSVPGDGVTSPISGTVISTGRDSGEKYIVIETEDGEKWILKGFERVKVNRGNKVEEGSILGSVGIGNSSSLTVSHFDSDGNLSVFIS